MKLSVPKSKKSWLFALVGLWICLLGFIPVRMAIAYYLVPRPQAILVLGGDLDRMRFAARLLQENPELTAWVSDIRRAYTANRGVFQEAGIAPERLRYDFCATDTVTNFTCTVRDLVQEGIDHVYLVTSDYHMKRARAIATVVFGSRGIVFTPRTVPSVGHPPESSLRIARDALRSLLWLAIGRTGASLNPRLSYLINP
jgi:uncharacterized SAM-binding protein YcdF (DUF218 family)